jgi:hypothetical protein
LVTLGITGAHAQDAGLDLSPNADPLDWMTGCWTHERYDQREVWSEDLGGLKFGYGVNRDANGKVTFFEDLRIENRPGGAVYIASPRGTAPTEFVETERTGLSITFENPDHDYPQKITYSGNRVSLVATISTIDDDRVQSWAMYDCAEMGRE